MALDHARDFFAATPFRPDDLAFTTPAWFMTRWATHFCAALFVLLAGIFAFLYGRVSGLLRLQTFLWTRGLWLVLLELTAVNLGWMFAWPWNEGFSFLQVIWALGWSMVALAALVRLGPGLVAAIGATMAIGHNLFDSVSPEAFGSSAWLWKILHVGRSFIPLTPSESFGLFVSYPLIPWVGVMALGYALGQIFLQPPERRQRALLVGSLVLTLGFVALRAINLYGDPARWAPQRDSIYTILSFIRTTKYPPSLLYLCMTLGPGLALIAILDRRLGPAGRFFSIFGRVPLFAYLIHLPLLNAASRAYFHATEGWSVDFFSMSESQWPGGYVPSLSLAYPAWLACIAALYPLCLWYGRFKATHRQWWLKYL